MTTEQKLDMLVNDPPPDNGWVTAQRLETELAHLTQLADVTQERDNAEADTIRIHQFLIDEEAPVHPLGPNASLANQVMHYCDSLTRQRDTIDTKAIEMAGELDTLRTQLAEAQEDTARLEIIARHGFSWTGRAILSQVRKAIDGIPAAMSQEAQR